MLNLGIFEKNSLFKKQVYQKDELVFDEWEISENIYVIKSGRVAVEKYTTDERQEVKELAILWIWNFFWEAALSSDAPKEVRIRAIDSVELLCINAKTEFPQFLGQNPSEALYLFGFIVAETNKRLLAANKQIIGTYEINKTISEIETIDNKSVFMLIDKIRAIAGCSYLLFLEKNPYVENTMVLKYDTRMKWKAQDVPITFSGNFPPEDFRKNKVYVSRFNHVTPLSIGSDTLGYLVFWHNIRDFNEWERKMVAGIATSIIWIIHQKKILEEERNKKYIKNRVM